MRLTVIALNLALAAGAVHAETIDLSQNLQLQTDLHNRIKIAGFDCAELLQYSEVSRDYRGDVYRIDCRNGHDRMEQSFRLVIPAGQPPRVERW